MVFHQGSALQKLVDDLQSITCICGRSKRSGESLCRTCYYALPQKIRMRLYDRIGEGYAEAFEAAENYLREEGRI